MGCIFYRPMMARSLGCGLSDGGVECRIKISAHNVDRDESMRTHSIQSKTISYSSFMLFVNFAFF